MNTNVKKNLKRKREKNRMNKRWTDAETILLLEYLQEEQDFEKPTAQMYYRKFLEVTGIDTSWDLVRWKVKNLKTSYVKAESWRNSTGVGLLETDEDVFSIQAKLRKMCRFYDELQGIFGLKHSEFSLKVLNSEITSKLDRLNSTSVAENSLNGQSEFNGFEVIDKCRSTTPAIQYFVSKSITTEDDSIEMKKSPSNPPSPALTSTSSCLNTDNRQKNKSVHEITDKIRNDASKNSLDQLFYIQNEKNSFLKLKLDFEREKFQKEFELKEREFEEQIKERKEKFELKKLEMEKEERLRVLEIEKEERIERYQIEMHYKHT